MKQLEKNYSPKEFEGRIYADWEEKGYFRAVIDKGRKPYCIVIPPPNITGQLHIGHALDNTLQDILIRFKRMRGFCALWLPGTDHASIATEARIVAAMKEEGLTKDDVGRDGFLERAWEWKRLYGGRIVEQLKKLGSSCDWERERFTLDEGCSKAVQKVFIDLYDSGEIYHGERIINWCPNCRTSISDVECEYEEKDGFFWHINYPVIGEENIAVRVATTRPETMLGDAAVAVHPNDKRYARLIGKKVLLPLMNREIPIIADEYVDMEFGTGAVKITPAHDPNDFEVGIRHNLPLINVMDDGGCINQNGGKYVGLERYEARKAVVRDLEQLGLLVKTEPHKHNVGGCQRCGTVVEPRASLQWFVSMKTLAEPAMEVVRNGRLRWASKRFENVYMQWMENIRDWCVSRQLWWGHRIPAYYCQNPDCGRETVSAAAPAACPKCGGAVKQDDDTLDTWFSSALWPFSTLGYPDDTEELRYFYPTSVIVPAYDIIPFWVARMIFSGLRFMNDVPFRDVFIHGLIRDEQGRKMSKSLGNGVDPLEVIDKYGADALRLTMIFGVSQDSDVRWSEAKVTAARNFANKLWNAARYVFMNLPDGFGGVKLPDDSALSIEDKWVLSKYNRLVKEVTANLDAYDLGVAAGKVHDFIWNVYCDWYIELTKPRAASPLDFGKSHHVLLYVMEGMLKLLHPFMPFITEEIWRSMPHSAGETESVMVSRWAEYSEKLDFSEEEGRFEKVVEVISAIRVRRSEMRVPPSKRVSAEIEVAAKDIELFKSCAAFFERLAGCVNLEISENIPVSDGKIALVTAHARAMLPMGELVDREKELARLGKELEQAKRDIEFISGKLSNEGFVAKAPPRQVENERAKLAKAKEKLAGIKKAIAGMSEERR
ncbi:MAG: valine--tRNA ligase [Oscillospiraceae bacterium]|jgi:valyl-tRNA synthetase|nr:valine--tRNA ligase [Oscillospiraceae bacterium]